MVEGLALQLRGTTEPSQSSGHPRDGGRVLLEAPERTGIGQKSETSGLVPGPRGSRGSKLDGVSEPLGHLVQKEELDPGYASLASERPAELDAGHRPGNHDGDRGERVAAAHPGNCVADGRDELFTRARPDRRTFSRAHALHRRKGS